MRGTLSAQVRIARTNWPGRLSRSGVRDWVRGGSRWGSLGALPPRAQGNCWRLGRIWRGSMLSTQGPPPAPSIQPPRGSFQTLEVQKEPRDLPRPSSARPPVRTPSRPGCPRFARNCLLRAVGERVRCLPWVLSMEPSRKPLRRQPIPHHSAEVLPGEAPHPLLRKPLLSSRRGGARRSRRCRAGLRASGGRFRRPSRRRCPSGSRRSPRRRGRRWRRR